LVEAQVSLGEATQLDFLKAQGNLLSVRAGLAEALHSHEEARAELEPRHRPLLAIRHRTRALRALALSERRD